MIRRLGIGCVLVAALALPAGAAAKNTPGQVKNAANHCKSLRSEMGRDAFRSEFGTNENGRNAFGKCVAKNAKGEARSEREARRECRDESAEDVTAFIEKYGSMRKCVTLKLREVKKERREALKDAVASCREEFVADPDAFMAKYGPDSSAETSNFEPGRPEGDRPAGDQPAGDAPGGDAPSGDAPSGDEPGDGQRLGRMLAFGKCVLSKVNAES